MGRILLLVDHKENRRLLARWLGQRGHTVLDPQPQELLPPAFDLGILDGPSLDRLWEQVQARRQSEQPCFLPFLLVTSRQNVSYVTRHLWKTVDELILTPIEQIELQARVEILLQARRFSVESDERYYALAEHSPVGVAILDDQYVRYANPVLRKLTGLRPGASLEEYFQQFHDDDRERVRDYFRDRIAGRPAPNRYEARLLLPDGLHWLQFHPTSVTHRDRPAVMKIALDITEQREIQEQMAAAKAVAEHASHAKDQFLAVLSHELRTPLTPVVAGVTMLQEGQYDESALREALEMIRRNVEMEARLIDDLLDVTRIVRGKIELQRQPTELGEILRRAVEICQADVESRQVHFSLDLGSDAPYWMEADPARLQQVFWNLLQNSVKFTPHGGCIGIRCRRAEGHVIAEVIDSGEGIEPHLLPHIFNPFEQGGARVTRQFGGLGLGLTITRGVVEMHGGTIEAHSEGKGKGALFRVRLPLRAAEELTSLPARSSPAHSAAPANGARHAEPAKPRILLVEDHGDTARVMRRLLLARGYEVQTAGDVATALELAQQDSFDLLLSDLGLPDGTGIDLVRSLREHGRTLPAIALSGYGQEEDIRRTKEAGFAAHLTKPASPDLLTRTIATVLRPGAAR